MINDIQAVQHELETNSVKLVDSITKDISDIELTEMLSNNIILARDRFNLLLSELLFKYADGYINSWRGTDTGTDTGSFPKNQKFQASSTGYPAWWLAGECVGYSSGPQHVSTNHNELII